MGEMHTITFQHSNIFNIFNVTASSTSSTQQHLQQSNIFNVTTSSPSQHLSSNAVQRTPPSVCQNEEKQHLCPNADHRTLIQPHPLLYATTQINITTSLLERSSKDVHIPLRPLLYIRRSHMCCCIARLKVPRCSGKPQASPLYIYIYIYIYMYIYINTHVYTHIFTYI